MDNFWQTPPAGLGISRRYVDVWLASTDLPDPRVQACARSLSEAELARAQEFKSKTGYREYIVTRSVLRRVLSNVTGLELAGVDFLYRKHGKPCLDTSVAGENVAFNVSHSHGLALVALTLGGRLGVDLEKIRPTPRWRDLARRYFSRAENQALDGRLEEDGRKAFFACWTRKEAFVKALGVGVAYGLREFEVSVGPEDEQVLLTLHSRDEDAADWLLRNLPVPAGYLAALAVDRPACRFRLWRVPES